jgi:hypothetical protein
MPVRPAACLAQQQQPGPLYGWPLYGWVWTVGSIWCLGLQLLGCKPEARLGVADAGQDVPTGVVLCVW